MHITEDGVKPAQILLPWSVGKKIQDILKKQGIDYNSLTHNQIASLIDKDVLEGISYRIPNQGPASNDAFEIVGFLPPQAGDTMVAYSGITAKTGSDFDIDKAYVILPNFTYDETSGKIKKVKYSRFKETKEGLENYRLDMMMEMLLHPSAYKSVMAPLDNDELEKYAKKLFPDNTPKSPLAFFNGTFQMETKNTFDSAKNLVGVIANHMAHHSLILSENIYLKDYYIGLGNQVGTVIDIKSDQALELSNTLEAEKEEARFEATRLEYELKGKNSYSTKEVKEIKAEIVTLKNRVEELDSEIKVINSNITQQTTQGKGFTTFSSRFAEDGKAIEGTLVAYMNAIVDAAKDPFIARANINQMTAGTAFMLARGGVNEKWITAFMGQPIIVEYVKATSLREGRYAAIPKGKDGKPMSVKAEVLSKFNIPMKEEVLRSADAKT